MGRHELQTCLEQSCERSATLPAHATVIPHPYPGRLIGQFIATLILTQSLTRHT
jgi:hypothetical protein